MGDPDALERGESKLDEISVDLKSRSCKTPWTVRSHKYPRTLEMDYKLTRTILGKGYSGSVILASPRSRFDSTDHIVAVKSFKLKGLKDHQKENLMAEIEIFLSLDHPHVARLLDVYETAQQVHLVMECYKGGELFDRFLKTQRFPEQSAAHTMRQMLLAVHYIHSHGIVHRDIKPQNFLYDDTRNDHVKMIDFGFSKFIPRLRRMKTVVGTPAYIAPEMIQKNYTCQCDLWALGVIGYMLLCGKMPFGAGGNTLDKLRDVMKRELTFEDDLWGHVSSSGKEFIQGLLQRDPTARLTSRAALQHSWITSNCSEFIKQTIDSSIVDSIMLWISTPKLQRACITMVSWSLTNEQRAPVRQCYVRLDKDHNGFIKWAEIRDAIVENKVLPSEEKEKEVCEILDSSPESAMTYTDFLAAMTHGHIELNEANVRNAFLRFDMDESGAVTTNEFEHLLGDFFEPAEMVPLIDKAGVLGADGNISYPDFAKLCGVNVDANAAPPRLEPPEKQPCCSLM